MTRLYYLEIKTYYKSSDGYEYQVADGGELPYIFTSKKTALAFAEKFVERNTKFMGYAITIPTSEHPAVKGNCFFAVRLEDEPHEFRKETRVYEISTF